MRRDQKLRAFEALFNTPGIYQAPDAELRSIDAIGDRVGTGQGFDWDTRNGPMIDSMACDLWDWRD